MSLEYIKILSDPEHQECDVLVRPLNYDKVPVTLPNWRPEACYMTSRYCKVGQQIKDMEIRPDDVWLAGFPKSGTNWCQEMIWLVCNDLDYATAAELNLLSRFCLVEMSGLRDDLKYFQDILSKPSPRFISTHLPVALLPDQIWTIKPRLVYVRRNPKAVVTSSYHHYFCLQLYGYKGTLNEYVESFMADLKYYSPYHNHVIEYHSLDYQGNILYLCYEDMNKNLKQELKRVCKFFNKSYSDDQLDALAEHLSFDKMKNNKSVNLSDLVKYRLMKTNRTDKLNDDSYRFIRKGESKGWKTELTEKQQQQLDEWTNRKVTDPDHLKLFQYD